MDLQDITDDLPPELLSDSEEEIADDYAPVDAFTLAKPNDGVDPKATRLRGEGEDVALCFRRVETLANRKIPKGETERIIKEYWKYKKHYDKKGPPPPPKPVKGKGTVPPPGSILQPSSASAGKQEWSSDPLDFFYVFLKEYRKLGSQRLITDWAYNILDACRRFAYDADCELWLMVITGTYDQALYWDEKNFFDNLSLSFQKVDKVTNKKVTGKLNKAKFLTELRTLLPLKTDVRYKRLKRSLAKEDGLKGNTVDYVAIFREDANGDQGPFAEMLRDQFKDEREEYIEDLSEALQAKVKQGQVSAKNCSDALVEIDPKKHPRIRDEYLRVGLGSLVPAPPPGKKFAKIDENIKIDVETFMQNLTKGVVKTSTNRDELVAKMKL